MRCELFNHEGLMERRQQSYKDIDGWMEGRMDGWMRASIDRSID